MGRGKGIEGSGGEREKRIKGYYVEVQIPHDCDHYVYQKYQ